MTIEVCTNSAWTLNGIENYLRTTVLPCRLACITGEGFPHVNSLWFLFHDGNLMFSVQRGAMVSRWLEREPKCGFEIAVNEAPYLGVRGRGNATCTPAADDTLLGKLIERFLGDDNPGLANWLLSRVDTEITITVTPTWLTSWDYGSRMS